MKNIDKIRAMSAEELARFAIYDKCAICSLGTKTEDCHMKCVEGMSEWLNQESKPMPGLQLGDIVETHSGLGFSYVAISPMTLVCRDERKQCNLEDIIKIITKIQRYDGEVYQTIYMEG